MGGMDAQCTYGSEPLPTAPGSFEWNASLLIDWLPAPLNQAATVAALVAGIPLGTQQTADFCRAEILTDEPTEQDWLNVVNPVLIPFAIANGGMARVMGTVKRQVWAGFCHCKAGPPPEGSTALWSQTFGPYAIGSGSWSATGLPEGAYITQLASKDATPTPDASGTFRGNLDWDVDLGGLYRVQSVDGLTAVDFYELPEETRTIPVGGVMAGTYVANVAGFTFTLYINGYVPESPPFVPDEPFTGLPELPDPAECSVDELCELLRRLVVQTSVNITFNDNSEHNVTDNRTLLERSTASSSRLERYLLAETFPPDFTTDPLTGEGTVNVDTGHVGFRITVTEIPEGLGRTGVGVPAYYHLGYVQLAYAGGWTRKYPIVSDPTVYMGIGPGCSGLRYVLADGVTIIVESLGPDPEIEE